MWQLIGLVTFVLTFHHGIVVEGSNQPNATVDCNPNGINITIVISGVLDVRFWTPEEWRLNNVNNKDCEPTFDNGTLTASYTFNGSTCATEVVSSSAFNYNFIINATRGGVLPTVVYDHFYQITCSYNRNGTARAFFNPLHDLSAGDSGREDLTFVLKLSADDSHNKPLAQNIPLGTPIHAQVSLDHQFPPQLDVSLVHIFLSKDQDGLLLPYSLISDSCVLESQANNQTRVTYDCENQLNSTNKDFSFVAVRYPGQDNGDSVWVHCVIYTCVVGDTSSVCVDQCANCTNRRRRRDVDTLPSDNTYEVIAGPYTFVEDENGKEGLSDGEEREVEKPETHVHVIIIVAVCGLVSIAIVCVTVYLVVLKRGKNFPLNETMSTSEMATENPAYEKRDINMTT